jgi:glycosyltransferase involved in cell wall biosynthesis
MRILQLVHTALQFEPPIFAMGRLLAAEGHEVACLGYLNPGLAPEEEAAPGYRLVRIARGDRAFLPRFLRGGLRYAAYRRGVLDFAARFSPDLVIPTNYDGLPVAVEIARASGCRLAYYCTEYSPPPGWREYLTGWGFLKRRERRLVAFADRVCSVEANRAALQASDWGRAVDDVVLNAPPFDAPVDAAAAAAVEGRDPADRTLRMVYAGSIGRRNCLEPLVDAVCALPGVRLDLCGRVVPEYREAFESLMRRAAGADDRIRYHGEIPYARLAGFLVEHDVGVTLYDGSHVNTRLASPAKLFQYLQAGLGVLTSDQPTPASIVSEGRLGVVADPARPGALREAVAALADAPFEGMRAMRRNALEAFRTRYTYERQVAPFMGWIRGEGG